MGAPIEPKISWVQTVNFAIEPTEQKNQLARLRGLTVGYKQCI